MELSEVLPFLEENHLAVVTTVSLTGRVQSTVVNAGLYEGRLGFVSRSHTVKIRNVRRTGRCVVTTIKPDTRRYVTVEGPATVHGWDNESVESLLVLLRGVYGASGRPPSSWEDFDRTMHEEQRTVVLVGPEHVYGSI